MFILLKMFKKKKDEIVQSPFESTFVLQTFSIQEAERKTSSIKVICTCRENKDVFRLSRGSCHMDVGYILWFCFLKKFFSLFLHLTKEKIKKEGKNSKGMILTCKDVPGASSLRLLSLPSLSLLLPFSVKLENRKQKKTLKCCKSCN